MTKHHLRFILAAALAVGFSLPLCSTARADHDWRDECHERLRHAKERVDRDAARFGRAARRSITTSIASIANATGAANITPIGITTPSTSASISTPTDS